MSDHTGSAESEHIRACKKNYLESLVALCPDGIIAIDRNGKITIFNRSAEQLTGHLARDTVGRMNIVDLYPSPQVARDIKKHIYAETHGGTGRLENYEVAVETRHGKKVPIRLSATLIYMDGEEIGSVGFFHDQTARKEMEEKLRHLSITDSLTELYNQRYFHVSLARELDRTARYKRPLSLICFDLDHFKQCNDTLGHLEGDNVLRLAGTVLSGSIRRTDMAFRYGGDEFFVLLPETVLDQARATAEKIRKGFNDRWPYDTITEGTRIRQVTMSMGVTEATAGETVDSLVKRADLAMYEAKRAGGDRVTVAAASIGT